MTDPFPITDYNNKKPFSNFLPGIAGLYGTPMWVFYVNRGQGIASFGTKNKDNAILEFFPANKAYQMTPSVGFRTFIKLTHGKETLFYEPFQPPANRQVRQSMDISSHEFSIEETNPTLDLSVKVKYFTVPGEPLAVLAREVTVTNLSKHPRHLEVIDGLPIINPYGMNEFLMKQMSRTIEAWMIVDNMAKRAPYFRLTVDAADTPQVIPIESGNFFLSGLVRRDKGLDLLDPIVDPSPIFGPVLDFSRPKAFLEHTPFRFPDHQMASNKTPCAMSLAHFGLSPHQSRTIQSFYGQANALELVNAFLQKAQSAGFAERKKEENRTLIESIKGRMFTATSQPAYDLYCGQTYLDNVIRGGLPVHFGKNGQIAYVYSRKHGDLERDYNRFLVEPAYFAQGDGNYRDVNQNRRNDPFFEPAVGDLNVKTFLNLIQLDGFNPLVIKGTQFRYVLNKVSRNFLKKFFGSKMLAGFERFFQQAFTLGELYRFLENRKAATPARFNRFLDEAEGYLIREERAEHGEGFWIDHWTYNLDLIESVLAVYPEEKERLLFLKKEYVFYDNDHRVKSRAERFGLTGDNAVRQYGSVTRDEEKAALLASRLSQPTLVRTRAGRGEIYKTTLFVKLLCLFTNKIASLDAAGVGIEMEADKPSWYDALNGLPGLLGSSLCETFELKRLALFLLQGLELGSSRSMMLPEELYDWIVRLDALLQRHFSDKARDKDLLFWDAVSSLKEKFRERTFFGLSGRERKIDSAAVKAFLEHAREKIDLGIEKAYDPAGKIYPTYFRNEVTAWKKTPAGAIKPTRFHHTPLPLFLEGPVHAMKVERDPDRRRRLYKAVRESGLYDEKLEMYKVNASLGSVSLEIGRARVFQPGWMENESIWLHMEYKFLLEVLRCGMAEEFFNDFKKALIPFQPAERYGRSILENSSFIVSSAFSEKSLHGVGFVARLSGSTAEFLSLWLLMNVGKRPFILSHDQKVCLRFEPQLPAFLFLREAEERVLWGKEGQEVRIKLPKNSLAFLFLSKTLVVYHNPKRLNTFGNPRVSVKKIILTDKSGKKIEFKGDTVPSPYAIRIRDEFVPRIDIELG
ncbi:MAG: hypothetical protein HY592_00710 [Candidatus Omnitrophica bacterium]|nr:hypothetical protein [Candidatus Omnitrophota bacterium]